MTDEHHADNHSVGDDGEPEGLAPQVTVAELMARLGRQQDTGSRRRRAAEDEDERDPSRNSDDPSRNSGDPSRNSDDPSRNSGDPSRNSGDPSRTSDDPREPAPRSAASGRDLGTDSGAEDGSDIDGAGNDNSDDDELASNSLDSAAEQPRSSVLLDPSEDGERDRRSIYQRHPAVRALLVVGIVVGIVAAYYVAVLFIARAQIARESVLRVDGAEVVDRPLQEGAQNYLITVSDSSSHDANGAQITALAHLSANEKRLVIVSFPRTTVVDIPPCGTAKKPVATFTGTIESAYAAGGARCSVAAVQATTGIMINHYIGVDLGKFPEVVDALGGIDVCLKDPLKDPAQKLSLPAGTTTLDGKQAADYVRAVNQGSGDDPARATRQIDFLSKLFSAALSAQTLINPVRATKFAFASAAALTIDDSTTLGQMRTLAGSLSDLGKHEKSGAAVIVVPPMSAATIPLPDSSAVGLRIDDNAGPAMFDAIINDQPLESTPAGGQDQQPADSTAKPNPNAGPGAVDDAQGSTWGAPSESAPTATAPVVETC
ncbi:LytR family transcriptional attenuator [Antricoccus suffuscus]|uniref:LytR family transcriptional attenuator n=1 Tax=Antricoccus suffuscus TaxID=1629062 RepID=A0A2T1A1A8_9ACTN|nr:LCP family protein [Antricoccus suffuscus]PRZ42391.1 LytR family transcriptional attenuator [Antricoccus suffuscus]